MKTVTLARKTGDSYTFRPVGGGVAVVFQSAETVGTYHLSAVQARAFIEGLLRHERFEVVPNEPLVG